MSESERLPLCLNAGDVLRWIVDTSDHFGCEFQLREGVRRANRASTLDIVRAQCVVSTSTKYVVGVVYTIHLNPGCWEFVGDEFVSWVKEVRTQLNSVTSP